MGNTNNHYLYLLEEFNVEIWCALLAVVVLWHIVFWDIHTLSMLPDFARLAHDHQPSLVAVCRGQRRRGPKSATVGHF